MQRHVRTRFEEGGTATYAAEPLGPGSVVDSHRQRILAVHGSDKRRMPLDSEGKIAILKRFYA
jgi:hypothetical protein